MTCRSLLAGWLILNCLGLARADYLDVRRDATVKASPDRDAAVVLRPAIGALLEILAGGQQENGYYHVRVYSSGQTGWIYRTLGRRYAGDPPSDTSGSSGVASDAGLIDIYWRNIRDLSSSSRTDAELAVIAQVLQRAEVVAVGELNDVPVLGALAAKLGPTWRHAASEKVGRSPHTAEHYGFLWNSAVLDIVGTVQVDVATRDTIDREPAWATFRTSDQRLDFTVVAIHVTWGETVGARKAEIAQLPAVWERVQAGTANDDDLILVGDFNRNIGDDSFDQILSRPGLIRATEDSPPTHVVAPSTYYQIFLDRTRCQEWTGTFAVHRFDEVQFHNNDVTAVRVGSDHRPVSITLRVAGR